MRTKKSFIIKISLHIELLRSRKFSPVSPESFKFIDAMDGVI